MKKRKRLRTLVFITVFLVSMFGGKNALYAIGTLTALYYIGQTNEPWEKIRREEGGHPLQNPRSCNFK